MLQVLPWECGTGTNVDAAHGALLCDSCTSLEFKWTALHRAAVCGQAEPPASMPPSFSTRWSLPQLLVFTKLVTALFIPSLSRESLKAA